MKQINPEYPFAMVVLVLILLVYAIVGGHDLAMELMGLL